MVLEPGEFGLGCHPVCGGTAGVCSEGAAGAEA